MSTIIQFRFWIAICALAGVAIASDAPPNRELAFKQQHLRERYEELERQLDRLGELLNASDPEAAHRVQAARQASRDGLVLAALQEAVQSLLSNRTKSAAESQTRAAEQLKRVLGLLQAQELSWEQMQQQLANLQQLRDRLDKLIQRQQALEKQSGEAIKKAAEGKPADKADFEKQKTEQAGAREETSKTATDSKQADKFPSDTVDSSAIERAATQMQQAEQLLEDSKAAEANARQRQALDELQSALGQVRSRMDAAKAEQQARTLAQLQDGLKAMLEKQKATTTATEKLSQQIDPKQDISRELRLKAAALAGDEAGLAERAQKFTGLLQEDGTSAVFGKVLEQSAEVLRDIETRLKQPDAGDPTQQRQKLVETNFQELLEALEQEQHRREAEGGGKGGSGGGKTRMALLPPAAELKMLRMLQDRVNRGTRSLQEDRVGHEQTPTPQESDSARQLSQRETNVSDATNALRRKWSELNAPQDAAASAPAQADPLQQFLGKLQQQDSSPLTPIGKDMEGVRDLLAKVETGEQTQDLQTQIIRRLNDLIHQAEQAQSQASMMATQPKRQTQQRNLPEAGQQPPKGNSQPSSPANISSLPAGEGSKGAPLNKIYGGSDSDAWGKLPQVEREKFLQTLKEKFPDRYQEMLKEYFKQLSTSAPPDRSN